METWLRAHGFAGPGLPDFRFSSKELQALKREQRLHQQLEKLLGGSSDRGLPDPEQRQLAMNNAFVEYSPVRLPRKAKPEPAQAPTTPHPRPRQSPATPLKPAATRRRYTRKMPPR